MTKLCKPIVSDDLLLSQATQLLKAGLPVDAVAILRQLIPKHSKNARLLHLAGNAELLAANYAHAANLLQTSLDVCPDQADTLCNLGLAFYHLGDFDLSAKALHSAIALKPHFTEALNNLSMLLLEGFSQPWESLAAANNALTLNSAFVAAHINRGNALQALDRFEEALAAYDLAITLSPDSASAHNNRGNALRKLGRPSLAISAYRRALDVMPQYPDALCNMGCALFDVGAPDEARRIYHQAISLTPSFANAYYNLGILEGSLNNRALALACYEKAIMLKPSHAEAYWNSSLLLLLQGDFTRGFALYEWGWKCGFRGGDRGFKAPRWLGQAPLAGKRLLIHHEQGLGDCIHYARYIQLAVNMGAKVILETLAPLVPLLKTLISTCQFVVLGSPLPPFDYYTPLMSLPLAFGTTLSNMPPAVPYLFADPVRVKQWSQTLDNRNKLRVGLVWSGSALHKNDRNRSVPLKMLAPLLSLPIEFHCLQKEFRVDDVAYLADLPMIHTHAEAIGDFADTAALVSLMDIVISVDTAVAHVAGALGKPVWLMLPTVPDWRWLLDREDSPWYPSARLFRQTEASKWDDIIRQIYTALSEILQKVK